MLGIEAYLFRNLKIYTLLGEKLIKVTDIVGIWALQVR